MNKTVSAYLMILCLISTPQFLIGLALNTRSVKASGIIYIRADGSIEPTTANISTTDKINYYFMANINDSIVVERNNVIVDGKGYTLQGSGSGLGFNLTSVSNVTIINSSIKGFDLGIYINATSHIVVFRNNITDYGIWIRHSSGNNVTSNRVDGIRLDYSSNNTLSANHMNNSSIYLHDSSNNTITKNSLRGSGWEAIMLYDHSNNNVLSENTIMMNCYYGIALHECWFNNLTDNTITGAQQGLDVWAYREYFSRNNITENTIFDNGIGLSVHNCWDNFIVHNNFIDNVDQAFVTWDWGVREPWNLWGENYWSDYNGCDADGDGIGDTRYCINSPPTANYDRSPLMHPYGSIRNLNTNLTYFTIQSAVDAPQTLDGHTIFVEEGTYYENIAVNKSVSLVGEDRSTTIIDGDNNGTVVTITASNASVSNFTIQNSGTNPSDCGLHIDKFATHSNISYNVMRNNYDGVHLYSSSFSTFVGNNITANNHDGIRSHNSTNRFVRNNIAANKNFGFYLMESTNNTLKDNAFTSNRYNFGVRGTELSNFINDVDDSNTVEGKPIFYLVNKANIILNNQTHPNIGYLAIINSTNITLRDLHMRNNIQGILFAYTKNSLIQDVSIENNYYGIRFDQSCDNNTVFRNNITDNYVGVRFNSCSNNTISRNSIMSTLIEDSLITIFLHNSSFNEIYDNTITYASCYQSIKLLISTNNSVANNEVVNSVQSGITLSGSTDNCISNNRIINNTGAGIELRGVYYDGALYSSFDNVITGNIISSNGEGISVGSNDNFIYRNNFISNMQQVYFITSNNTNAWDNGVEGNYWSNYTGVDSDLNGIGDTEHVIDANNTDNYPLIGMFSDFNVTSECHVQAVCNSSISDLVFNGTAISFDVSGENETTGFCRICIPTALMNATYRVFVNGTEILPYPEPLPCSSDTHNYLYFTYNHSTQEVVIIPEFPSFLILPLFMIATLLAVIVYRRKQAM